MDIPVIYNDIHNAVLEINFKALISVFGNIFDKYDDLFDKYLTGYYEKSFNTLHKLKCELLNTVMITSNVSPYISAEHRTINYYPFNLRIIDNLIKENSIFIRNMYAKKNRLNRSRVIVYLDKKFGIDIANLIMIYTYNHTDLNSSRFRSLLTNYKININNNNKLYKTLKRFYLDKALIADAPLTSISYKML